MDTTQKVSASTITGFLQSEDDNASMPRCEEGRQHHRSQQVYPPPPPPPAYYSYYPPPLPLPVAHSMSYFYMDLIKHLSMQNEIRNYLPKLEGLTNENKSKDNQSRGESRSRRQERECDIPNHDDLPKTFSRLCLSCEQHLRCSCCSKPLSPDRTSARNSHSYPHNNCFQCLLPLHSLMHLNPNQVLQCNCPCQKQTEKTKRKPKQKCKKNKCNPMCLQLDHSDPERDNPLPPMINRGTTNKRTYRKDDSHDSSDTDESCSFQENRGDCHSENKSEEERRFGFFAGNGDENKIDSSNQKSDLQNNRVRKTRRSLAYFINV